MQTQAFASPETHLFLFGGGNKNPVALQKWMDAGTKKSSHLLLIHWGTDYPIETCQDFIETVGKIANGKVLCSPPREQIGRQKKLFLRELRTAQGIFFAGGDQNKIMEVFDHHPDLKSAIIQAFKNGIPVAGTSAGTAIQSRTMISGETPRVQTRSGLGLVSSVIVDQHFIRRNREERLKEALLNNSETLGLGVDEDAALVITNGRYARPVFGPTVLIKETANGFIQEILTPGDEVDLSIN